LRGGYRGRRGGSYGGQPGTTSLDRRPTTILISEVDVDIKDAVLAHMSKFGEVVDPVAVVSFFSMTTLLTHTVSHSTRYSFRHKTNNHPIKKNLSLAVS
jgi:hypothetical protein